MKRCELCNHQTVPTDQEMQEWRDKSPFGDEGLDIDSIWIVTSMDSDEGFRDATFTTYASGAQYALQRARFQSPRLYKAKVTDIVEHVYETYPDMPMPKGPKP